MYGIQLPSGVPSQDPANGTNLTVSSSGRLQLSVGGAAASDVSIGSISSPIGTLSVSGTGAVHIDLAAGNNTTLPSPASSVTLSNIPAGGVEIELIIKGNPSNEDFLLQFNAIATNYASALTYVTTAGAVAGSLTGNLGAGANTTGMALIRASGGGVRGRIKISPTGGGDVFATSTCVNYDATTGAAGNPGLVKSTCVVPLGATPLTSVKFIAADGSSSFGAGSSFTWRPLGMTAAT